MKKRILFLSILALQGIDGWAQKEVIRDHYQTILFNAGKMLEVIHYQPRAFQDDFSKKIFLGYFNNLDPQKKIFLQSDIDQLRGFEGMIDDEIQGKVPVQFFKRVHEIYLLRLKEAESMVQALLKEPYRFDLDLVYRASADSLSFPSSLEEKKQRWFLSTSFQILSQFDDLMTPVLRDSSAMGDFIGKPEAWKVALKNPKADTIERKARELISKANERYFANLIKKSEEEESFSVFMNTIINEFDPHSTYYLPVGRREFVEDLSGVYYGIGALLQEQNGNISVNELVIGGPAWRSQQIEKGDVIIRVAQEGEKPTNVEGLPMPDLIKLTRGKKDTKVTITFRKADGTLREVTMVRTALQLEDTFLKTAIIEQNGQKIGYIFLPKFYTSFGDKNGRSCADDMEAAVTELKKNGIEGLVIDVRDNGGGSLGEVIDMVGIFVDGDPVVQVRSRDGRQEVGKMRKKKIYDGPLVVLVNELSASASEIFAGAIQDYNRGIVMGANTFGKGTVQRAYRIPGKNWDDSQSPDLGTLHVTIQKYYRINGSSTQLKGVEADFKLPGIYERYKLRERDNQTALAWDEINSLRFKKEQPFQHPKKVNENIQKVLSKDSVLQKMEIALEKISASEDVFPLRWDLFRADRQEKRAQIALINQLRVQIDQPWQVSNTPIDSLALIGKEQFRLENNKAWLRSVQRDRFLQHAVMAVQEIQQEDTAGRKSKTAEPEELKKSTSLSEGKKENKKSKKPLL